MEPSAQFKAIVARSRELGSFPNDGAAERALVATLQGLARVFTQDERKELARALPAELRHVIPTSLGSSTARESDFYLWAAVAEGVPMKRALKHAPIACRALGEQLPSAVIARLSLQLPMIGRLLSPGPRASVGSVDSHATVARESE